MKSTSQMFTAAIAHSEGLLEQADGIELRGKEVLLELQICSELYQQAAHIPKEAARESYL